LSSSKRSPPNKRRIPEASGGSVAQGARSGYEERQFTANEDQMSVADKTQVKKSGGLGETLSVIFQALILAIFIRSFISVCLEICLRLLASLPAIFAQPVFRPHLVRRAAARRCGRVQVPAKPEA
jgi:hypothetical protein